MGIILAAFFFGMITFGFALLTVLPFFLLWLMVGVYREPPYSLRNASVGSIRRPRLAGPSDARTPTSSMNAAAPGRMPGIDKPPICSIGT